MNLNQNDRFGASGRPMPGTGFEAGRLAEINDGLRKHMLRIYNIMSIGLVVTALVAWMVGSNEALYAAITGNMILWIGIAFAPLLLYFVMRLGVQKMSVPTLGVFFLLTCVAFGFSTSTIVAGLDGRGYLSGLGGADVLRAFLITAGTFAGMSLVGYTTKKDLSGLRGLMTFAAIGLLIAIVVHLFVGGQLMGLLISAAIVVLFSVMIMIDTKDAKEQYLMGYDSTTTTKLALLSALELYWSVVVIFRNLVYILNSFNE